MTYEFLQQYWWFLVSLLGALLVFLLFVQGANSMIFSLSGNDDERHKIVASTGRKWELTFTTLVTFGGAFFASFPLFYSTSFGGAYWVWLLILLFFVLQAVSYEFQHHFSERGERGKEKFFQWLLVLNGVFAPFLLGAAVSTFFEGANFTVEKTNIVSDVQPIISQWANGWHGLDALADPWVWVFGLAVLFLARILGTLYIMNNVDDANIRARCSSRLLGSTVPFLVLFVAFLVHLMITDGYAVDAEGVVSLQPHKYLDNLLSLWPLAVALVVGLVLALYGIIRTIACKTYIKGIWPTGVGVVLVVLVLLLIAGWNGTSYYPSLADPQCSLTIANSCSSEFTLRTMAWVSLLIPFVVAYIAYCWWSLDKKD